MSKKRGKLIIEIGLNFGVDPDSDLRQLKNFLSQDYTDTRKNSRKTLHTNIKTFFKEVNAGPPELKTIYDEDPFMYSVQDPDDPR